MGIKFEFRKMRKSSETVVWLHNNVKCIEPLSCILKND